MAILRRVILHAGPGADSSGQTSSQFYGWWHGRTRIRTFPNTFIDYQQFRSSNRSIACECGKCFFIIQSLNFINFSLKIIEDRLAKLFIDCLWKYSCLRNITRVFPHDRHRWRIPDLKEKRHRLHEFHHFEFEWTFRISFFYMKKFNHSL